MRKNIFTAKWLKEFKELQRQERAQATSIRHKKRQAASIRSDKHQASSIKRGGPAHNQAPNLVKKKI